MSNISTLDKKLAFSKWVEYLYKILVFDNNNCVVDEIKFTIDYGSVSIDSSSNTRRTYSFTMFPIGDKMTPSERARMWMNKKIMLQVGLKTPRMSEYKWYNEGCFIVTDTNSSISVDSNSLTINCGDLWNRLDGTQNGQLSALTTTIPAYEETDDGTPLVYNTIRDSLVSTITQLGGIKDYIVDDIGESKGLEEFNKDYMSYRASHPYWNCVPYDLEFSVGDNVSSMITDITELYPNFDSAFDENGIFITRLTPSCKEDNIIITNDDIKNCLVSESISTDYSNVRNVVHVWGETFDVDFYSEDVTNSNSTYTVNMKAYHKDYSNGDLIAIKIPDTNSSTQYINVNNLGNIQIYNENTDKPLAENYLPAGKVYVFKFRKTYQNKTWIKRFYAQGAWQAHALSALVDGSVSSDQYTCADGTVTTKYTKKYFQDKYNVDTVSLKVIKDSPFTVQKLGEERLDVKSGDVYENISSDSLALERAEYELFVDARLTDNISIEIGRLIPWLKEYMKVSYAKIGESEIKQYITDKITLNLTDGTTSITMHTFYPLYEE